MNHEKLFIKACVAGLVLSVTRILRAALAKFNVYVCVCNYFSLTTEPICIKIIPANRASNADCYRLLRFEIFTKCDEYCPRERCTLHRRIFANGIVLRDVVDVISVTIGVFRNNPD